jgi:hypothetical protein
VSEGPAVLLVGIFGDLCYSDAKADDCGSEREKPLKSNGNEPGRPNEEYVYLPLALKE